MTSPFTPIHQNTDRLDIAKRGNQLMIVKVWDHPEYVRTPHNKDGMVHLDGREPFPNRAIRAAVVDLGAIGPDGQPGVLYPETWFQASSMMKEMRNWVGQLKLITWLQDQEPKDPYGNPRQTNPYTISDHTGNPDALAIANDYLARHPEFNELPAPAPYDGKPPVPEAPAVQQGYQQQGYGQQPGYGYQQGPPPQQQPWQSPQQYPPAQPGYGGPPPQQPSWQPPAPPQQQPAAWNTAAPPPGYYQQQGPPPQQQPAPPQQQPGNFYQAAQNHHGQSQPVDPPW